MSVEAMKKALDVLVHVTTLSSKKARDGHAKAVSGLREAIAAAEKAAPVAWSPRYSYFGYETQRAWCNGMPRPQDVDYYSRLAGGIDYAYTTPPDTAALLAEKDALLRQALEALEGLANITNESQGVAGFHLNGDTAEWDEFDEVEAASNTIEAIRNHLGVKND